MPRKNLTRTKATARSSAADDRTYPRKLFSLKPSPTARRSSAQSNPAGKRPVPRAQGRRKHKKTGLLTYGVWSRQFKKDAAADEYRSIAKYASDILGLRSGRKVIKATLWLISELCGLDISGPDYEHEDLDCLLRMQSYDMKKKRGLYAVGVRVVGCPVPARILSNDPAFTDLFELHYGRGLISLIVSRTDSKPISNRDYEDIKECVTASFELEDQLDFIRFNNRVVVPVLTILDEE